MDLPGDRYYGLSEFGAMVWQAIEQGHTAAVPFPENQFAQQVDEWVRLGLMTFHDRPQVEIPIRKEAGTPAIKAFDDTVALQASFSWTVLCRLFLSTWRVNRILRHQGICVALKQIQEIAIVDELKTDHCERQLGKIIRTYRLGRRVLSQGQEDCLPRSLALAYVLRHAGIEAEVCFGVRQFPFYAHAWVEANGRVLNDEITTIGSYAVLARF